MANARSRVSSHIRVWIEPGLMALTVIRVSASSSARFSVRLWVGGWLLRAVRLDEDHLAAGAFEDGNVDVELVPELLLPLSEGALGGQDEEPRRYHGSVKLNPTRLGRDASAIADEVIAHLSGPKWLLGANVRITMEIEAENRGIPGGERQ